MRRATALVRATIAALFVLSLMTSFGFLVRLWVLFSLPMLVWNATKAEQRK